MSFTKTFFDGAISVEPPLNTAERDFLSRFSGTQRVRRARGPYYVGGGSGLGGAEDDIEDATQPAHGQPGLWCRWRPTADGSGLAWSGEDRFADADAWMAYVIDHFLRPGAVASRSSDPQFLGFTFDHVCNGVLLATGGEDDFDRWVLVVRDNAVGVADLPAAGAVAPQRFSDPTAEPWDEVPRDRIGRFLPGAG